MSSEPVPTFPFPLESVRGSEAAKRLIQIRREHAGTGFTPVILGDRESVERLMESYELNSEEVVVPGAMDQDVAEWLKSRVDEDPEFYEGLDDAEVYPDGVAPMNSLAVGFDHRGKERQEVWIALVKVSRSSDLPVALQYGGWNACPRPEEHVMMARYWEEKYGAEIASITSDTIEFTVARPPGTPEECAALAREMYVYCGDIVDQGVGSVPTLAKCLARSTVWFFWWD